MVERDLGMHINAQLKFREQAALAVLKAYLKKQPHLQKTDPVKNNNKRQGLS